MINMLKGAFESRRLQPCLQLGTAHLGGEHRPINSDMCNHLLSSHPYTHIPTPLTPNQRKRGKLIKVKGSEGIERQALAFRELP